MGDSILQIQLERESKAVRTYFSNIEDDFSRAMPQYCKKKPFNYSLMGGCAVSTGMRLRDWVAVCLALGSALTVTVSSYWSASPSIRQNVLRQCRNMQAPSKFDDACGDQVGKSRPLLLTVNDANLRICSINALYYDYQSKTKVALVAERAVSHKSRPRGI